MLAFAVGYWTSDQRPSDALLARRQPAPMSGFTNLVRIGK
jgi:hypothetical protein